MSKKNISPNFNERKNNGADPSYIMLHYTETLSTEHARAILCGESPDPKHKDVSAHYLVSEDGTVEQLVADENRAWHAGKGEWCGIVNDMNSHSIGIEIVNPGHRHGYRDFPEAQMKAVAALCLSIMERYNIAAENVIAHSDYAPGRKIDPGEKFDWKSLAAQGIGVWPDDQGDDRAVSKDDFVAYGYGAGFSLEHIVAAFQQHFYPEIFEAPDKVGKIDDETSRRLRCLLRKVSPL